MTLGPVQQWIATHLLPGYLSPLDKAKIELYVLRIPDPTISSLRTQVFFRNGYPMFPALEQGCAVRHLVVAGCRATAYTRLTGAAPGFLATLFVLCTPDRKLEFNIVAASYRKNDQTDREVEAILRSVRIEKSGNTPKKK